MLEEALRERVLRQVARHSQFSPLATNALLVLLKRRRLGELPSPAGRSAASLVREDGGLIGLRPASGGDVVKIGEARDAALALAALRAAEPPNARPSSIVDGVDERAVMDVIFGPPRALSDPASKAALAPYGVPFPLEELCTSPSRAAAEAQRIGFPVRVPAPPRVMDGRIFRPEPMGFGPEFRGRPSPRRTRRPAP